MLSPIVSLFLICGGALPGPTRGSCDCIRLRRLRIQQTEVQAEVKHADVVFSGRVVAITDTSVAGSSRTAYGRSAHRIVVRVDSLWKGSEADSLVVWTECDYPFQVDSSYVIFANQQHFALWTGRHAALWTGICSLTQSRSTAETYIRALGTPKFARRS